MGAMFWGIVAILAALLIFSLVSVQFVRSPNSEIVHEDPFCKEAFDTVQDAMLLFWQTTVAFDAWGTCFVPLARHAPFTVLISGSALVCVQLGFMNLILSVVVEAASQARE